VPNVDIFYGITTTTLVVLTSVTLVVSQQLVSSIQSSAKLCKDSINELNSKEEACDKEILITLGHNTEVLLSKYQGISTNTGKAYLALYLVIFLSAVSIFLTLLSGVFDLSIPVKCILFINLVSISIYIVAFLSLLLGVKDKKKCLKIITSESEMRIKSIDDTNVLYQILSEKNKEKRKR
jgi:hypothetical protein